MASATPNGPGAGPHVYGDRAGRDLLDPGQAGLGNLAAPGVRGAAAMVERPPAHGDKVLYQGLPYESKWDNEGVSPAGAANDPADSPWKALYKVPGEPVGTSVEVPAATP